MTNIELIKALSNANIYITDFVRTNKYCTFTIKRTDLLNHPELNLSRCTLTADPNYKNFFSADYAKKIVYIGQRTCLDKWVMCVEDNGSNVTCTNHKIKWNPTNSSYDGYANSVSDLSIPTNMLGVRVFNYSECYANYCTVPDAQANWVINPGHSTVIDHIYIIDKQINFCNIIKKSTDELTTNKLNVTFYKDMTRSNSFGSVTAGKVNGRKRILERM